MEKLYLFTEPQYKRLRQVRMTPQEVDFYNVYREMIRTLHRKDLTDEEKWDVYQRLLERYLSYVHSEERNLPARAGESYVIHGAAGPAGPSRQSEVDGPEPEEPEAGPSRPRWARRSFVFEHPSEVTPPATQKKKSKPVKPVEPPPKLSPRKLRKRHAAVQTGVGPIKKKTKMIGSGGLWII